MAINRADYRQYPVRAIDRWILGVDLGQSSDPTAICALHHQVVPLDEWDCNDKTRTWKQRKNEYFDVPYLRRLSLGMPYPDQAHHVREMLARPPLVGAKLVVDETGVGRAVADIFNSIGLHPQRVTITAGLDVTHHGGDSHHVPKGVLISGLDARLHTRELRFAAAMSEAGALQEELKDFQRSVSAAGRATYAARTGKHDDLVLAVAISVWWATARIGEFSAEELRL